MRAGLLAPTLLLAACVSRVVGTASTFPGRADWRSCARERLTALGYRVAPEDTLAPRLEAARRGVRMRVSADSADRAPTLRVVLEGAAGRPDVDSLVVYCGGAGG